MCSFRFSLISFAAHFPTPVALALQSVVGCHPIAQSFQNMANERIAVLRPAIMRPFAIMPRLDQTRALEKPQVTRHFRLDDAERIGQVANTGLTAGQEIEQTQSRWIRQSFEQGGGLAPFRFVHDIHIRLSVYVSRALECRTDRIEYEVIACSGRARLASFRI
jgi:hypothetical protein